MKYISALFIGVMVLIACQSEPESSVVETPNGYTCEILIDEEGKVIKPGNHIFFHVRTVVDEQTIDDTRKEGRARRFQLPQLERLTNNRSPIIDAFRVLSKGDSARIAIPAEQAQRLPNYQEGSEAYYYLTIKDVMSNADYQEKRKADNAEMLAELKVIEAEANRVLEAYKSGELDDELKTTASGLKYIVHEVGDGPRAQPGKRLSAHYYGMLMDGTVFDNSYKRGRTFDFVLDQGQVIKGWDEGFQLLNIGSKATFFIPPDLGYGERGSGSIPPNSELMFYVEAVDQ